MDILAKVLAAIAALGFAMLFAYLEDFGRANFFLVLAAWTHLDLMLKRLREGDDT